MAKSKGYSTERVLVSIPPMFLGRMDKFAEERELSRSELIRRSVEFYMMAEAMEANNVSN